MHPEITIVWADLAYACTLFDWAKSLLHLTIKTVSRLKGAKRFAVLPQHSETMLTLPAITLMPAGSPGKPSAPMPRRHVQRPHFEPLDLSTTSSE